MEASFHTGFLFAFYFKVLSSIPYLLVNSTGPPPVGSTSGSLVSHGLFICILFQSVEQHSIPAGQFGRAAPVGSTSGSLVSQFLFAFYFKVLRAFYLWSIRPGRPR